MVRFWSVIFLFVAAVGMSGSLFAADSDLDKLRSEIEDLRRRINEKPAEQRTSVDKALESKYGPNASVTTKVGKLEVGGLIQVWYTSFQKDSRGLFDTPNFAGNAVTDLNRTQSNDSFRIRRSEIRLAVDIHENVSAVVMIDPAREATSFPYISDNQGNPLFYKRMNNLLPGDDNALNAAQTAQVGSSLAGSGGIPRLLQDAYINYHGVIPHHDFQLGQYKVWMGEEGVRSNSTLDFAERSFLGAMAGDARDLGTSAHGSWWDDRFQYWVGMFDGAGNYYASSGQEQNRSDDNDQKDFNYRVFVRPLWKDESWGSLELGMSSRFGKHGKNSLGRPKTMAFWHNPWISYAAGGIAKGLWIKGEYAWIRDRNAPGAVFDPSNTDTAGQAPNAEFNSRGWYASVGYRFSESASCGCNDSNWLSPVELLFRYDTFQNVEVADPALPYKTDVFWTRVYTAGMNYYIKGNNAKIQFNYNFVRNPRGNSAISFHNVRNDSFVLNFQVAF